MVQHHYLTTGAHTIPSNSIYSKCLLSCQRTKKLKDPIKAETRLLIFSSIKTKEEGFHEKKDHRSVDIDMLSAVVGMRPESGNDA